MFIDKYKREIVFDFSIDNLKKYYTPFTKKKYTVAYKDLGKTLEKLGFEHRQGSAYVSKNELDEGDCKIIYKTICKKLPWFELCFTKFDIPVAHESYNDYNDLQAKNYNNALLRYKQQLFKRQQEQSQQNLSL